MNILLFIVIYLIVYGLSVYLCWKYISIAHSKIGIWSYLNPDFSDVFICFVPLFNTMTAMFSWIFFYPVRKESNRYHKFFKIKK